MPDDILKSLGYTRPTSATNLRYINRAMKQKLSPEERAELLEKIKAARRRRRKGRNPGAVAAEQVLSGMPEDL